MKRLTSTLGGKVTLQAQVKGESDVSEESSEICLKERRTIFQKDEQRKGEARARCFKLLLSLLIDMVFVFNSALGE